MRRGGMLLCALVFVGGLVLLVFLAPGWFSSFNWGWSSGSYGWGPGPWWWGGFSFPFIGLGMFVFCLVMMGGMMMHGRPFAHGSGSGMTSLRRESLSEILERRYSQGEITKQQFEEMKQALGVYDAGLANEHG